MWGCPNELVIQAWPYLKTSLNLCMLSLDDTSFTTVKWQSSKFAAPNIFLYGFGELLYVAARAKLSGNGTFPFPFLLFIYFLEYFTFPIILLGQTHDLCSFCCDGFINTPWIFLFFCGGGVRL